ncbi:MAG: UbiA prenyltransferase family protein [Planctomycetes bacterium]|nr:UbiA prenyltransferase family protein [Planctomycetota bacterium]
MKLLDIKPYISLSRPDHWFKNGFMALGILLAFFVEPELFDTSCYITIMIAIIVTCLIASSNYVINEIRDVTGDKQHPVKKNRPVPSGRICLPYAYAEWVLLGFMGLLLAYCYLNLSFLIVSLIFWMLGVFYNIPPFRTKEMPYLDVLSEAFGNPLRLLLGWFSVIPDIIPPVSLVIAYWMAGAFFMGVKRFAEYRTINDPEALAKYRNSFIHYTERRLLFSIFYYAVVCSFFLGIFIINYHLELIICAPLFLVFFSYYLKLGFKPDSLAQTPEYLYKDTTLMIYLAVCLVSFISLMFTKIEFLYTVFKIVPYNMKSLWNF